MRQPELIKFKLNCVLKLIELNGTYNPNNQKMYRGQKLKPLSPDLFQVYAYPEYHKKKSINWEQDSYNNIESSDERILSNNTLNNESVENAPLLQNANQNSSNPMYDQLDLNDVQNSIQASTSSQPVNRQPRLDNTLSKNNQNIPQMVPVGVGVMNGDVSRIPQQISPSYQSEPMDVFEDKNVVSVPENDFLLNNGEFDDYNKGLLDDDQYIESLHQEIDKRARLEFNKEKQKFIDTKLKEIFKSIDSNNTEIIGSQVLGDERNKPIEERIYEKLETPSNNKPLPVRQAVRHDFDDLPSKPADFGKHNSSINEKPANNHFEFPEPSYPEDINASSIAKQSPLNVDKPVVEGDSEIKFTIKIDKNEQDHYYTDVLDAVDKLFENVDNKSFKTMTDIVDEILDAEESSFKNNDVKKIKN